MQAHGGSATIVSDPQAGTTVSFTLPAATSSSVGPSGEDAKDVAGRAGAVGRIPRGRGTLSLSAGAARAYQVVIGVLEPCEAGAVMRAHALRTAPARTATPPPVHTVGPIETLDPANARS